MKTWLVLGLLLLSGCATLSKDQCKTVEWSQQGERDAYGGYAKERIEEHTKACAEHGITPDRTSYVSGFERGLGKFCQTQRGFDYGRAGSSYRNTCPVDLEPLFQRGYLLGKQLYSDENAKSSIESQIRQHEKKLREAKTDDERVKLRNKLRDLDGELMDRNRKLRALDDDILRAGLSRR